MPVEHQPLPDQRVELPGEKVGQVERARLGLVQRPEQVLPGIEGVAMRSVDPGDARLVEHRVERTASPAIGVERVDPREAARPGIGDPRADRVGDPLRPVVQSGGQALDGQVGPAVRGDHGERLARERAAGDHERTGRGLAQAAFWLCLRAITAFAVSTATAASRQ